MLKKWLEGKHIYLCRFCFSGPVMSTEWWPETLTNWTMYWNCYVKAAFVGIYGWVVFFFFLALPLGPCRSKFMNGTWEFSSHGCEPTILMWTCKRNPTTAGCFLPPVILHGSPFSSPKNALGLFNRPLWKTTEVRGERRGWCVHARVVQEWTRRIWGCGKGVCGFHLV